MTRRGLCRLLFVLVALSMSAAASAGRGGGWYHSGGGGWGGGSHGSNWSGGGYGGVNHGSSWSGGGWNGGYHGSGWYHGSYYHGGYYHGGYYHGWYGCCGSVSVGFYFGPGFVYGYPFYPYYYPPYYASVYYPYVSGDLLQPAEYVEQGQDQGQAGVADMDDQGGGAPQLAFWYYCASSRGYYPYVRSCSSGWQKVPARPPDS
ncbi:hypothetical protein [Paraburkholderia oxyphila]|uniref:hypothetical protein n=1 Tax=Paraburkholderia oxyphila TaxID=614212 RepID=UPI001FDEF264|nr:hypothetical protein [Paraburkholderia oxyphila]